MFFYLQLEKRKIEGSQGGEGDDVVVLDCDNVYTLR
jgi:hypothetical protein